MSDKPTPCAQQAYRPNEHLIGVPGSRDRLATPSLILDLDALEHNIAKMAELCKRHGISSRPHAKTHKSTRIAKMQEAAGADGICTANIYEAHVMAAAGISSIHLTSPLVGEVAIGELIGLVADGVNISAVTDSVTGLEALDRQFAAAGQTLKVLVDVDLQAMYRTGVANTQDAIDLAVRIRRSKALKFGGLQYYSGIVQHIPSARERSEFYGQQLKKIEGLIAQLTKMELKPPVVSGGGTGTVAIDAASGIITENQAGSYVIMDVEYGAIEMLEDDPHAFRSAAFVQCSVISNNCRGMVTIDGGSKSLALDGPKPRVASGAPADCMYQIFGDEFGVLIFPGAMDFTIFQEGPPATAAGEEVYKLFYELFGSLEGEVHGLEIGAKVELTAPHCDPTVNLFNHYHCVRGDTLVDIWPVDARGNL